MVGAVTVLIAIVAVFLAYNANSGLPFVPVYRVSVDIPNAARIVDNNEVRIGGVRVGVVESIDPVPSEAGQRERGDRDADGRVRAAADRGAAEPEARQDRRAAAAGLDLPRPLPLGLRPQVPRDRARRRAAGARGARLRRHRRRRVVRPADRTGAASPPRSPARAETAASRARPSSTRSTTPSTTPTRRAQRENLVGYGSALAGRGVSLNETIAELPRLFGGLKPVARALSDPEVNLSRFIRGLYRYARYAAPAAREQAQFFDFAATAFRAISSNPERLKEAISEAPLTYETGIRLLPRQRVFLAQRRAVRAPDAARRGGPAHHPAGAQRCARDRRSGAARLAAGQPASARRR